MRARGVHTYGDYARVLDADAAEYDRLLDALTINVTKLFRNWEVYASMAANVVPALWYRQTPRIRVWSAGCSSGDEPYSLGDSVSSIRVGERHARAARPRRACLARTSTASASTRRRAASSRRAISPTRPLSLRQRYFTPTAPFAVAAAIRDIVRFESRDLLSEPPPAGPVRPDRLSQRADLLRSRNARALVRDVLSCARAGRISRARQSRNDARADSVALRAGRLARADLSSRMSAEPARSA